MVNESQNNNFPYSYLLNCRYYSNSYSNSQYYSQARMLNDVASNMGDWNLLGLVTKALEVYKQMNEDE